MNKVIHKTTLSLLGVTILSSLLLSSTHVFSDTEVIDEVRLTVPIACTMSGTGTTHTATLGPGTYSGASGNEYENGIGKTTLAAICNDDNGFSIYAIGFTGDEYGVTNLVGDNTAGTIATKAYASGDTTSNWSMKLTKVTDTSQSYNPTNLTISTGYDAWHAVPADYTKVAEYHASTGSSTTDTTLGVKLETTYAAFIASSQAADIYKGQVKYTMVHPYNKSAPQPPLGLCEDANTCMQQQTSASMAEKLPNVGDTTTLYDARDNQAYTVAKLADGKYWMTENLNIAGGTALSSEDTDFEASYTLPTTDGWTVADGKLVLPASSTSGYDGVHVYNSGNKNNCGTSDQYAPCYSYYSWNAATLGSGESLSTNNADAPYSICPKGWRLPRSRKKDSVNNFDAALSIESDYYELAISYGMTSGAWGESSSSFYNQAGPGTISNFLLAGEYRSSPAGWIFNPTIAGLYLSSTKGTLSANTPGLHFFQDSVYSNDPLSYNDGYSVRCLFKTN